MKRFEKSLGRLLNSKDVLGVGRGTISREKAQKVYSKSDLTLHLLVCVLRKVAGWIALAKLIIEHIGFVPIASVGEECAIKRSRFREEVKEGRHGRGHPNEGEHC